MASRVTVPGIGTAYAAAGLVLLTGCGSTRFGEPWGARATVVPGWDRTLESARDAAFDPMVWAPLAAATVIWAGGWDDDISDWAREETPVFGSTEGAEDASDEWRALAQDAWIVSVFAAPSGDEPWPWAWNKAKGYAVQAVANKATSGLTSLGKSAFDRERPNGSNDRSMPSGHTTSAFANTTLARRNVDAMRLEPGVRVPIQAGLVVLGSGTAWARVEAGAHYPTDVLVGAALGSFVARFVDDLFLDPAGGVRVTATVDPEVDAWSVGLAWTF